MLHSIWAWVVLAALVIGIINAILGLTGQKTFQKRDQTLSLLGLVTSHVQLLFGLGVYFVSNGYHALKAHGMKHVMSESSLRNQVMEHPLTMLIAIILITVGYSKHKRLTNDKAKFKTIAIYYGIGLLLILAKIPWGDWL
ncbi:MAG TPA: hypothetical protein ENK85_11620 [Saprospiraceae bacterium]|nr:hypothetical protein [Saprospiraceae bacterium]